MMLPFILFVVVIDRVISGALSLSSAGRAGRITIFHQFKPP
jgi:hypothetical protein